MAYTTRPEDNEAIANLPGDIRAVTDLVTGHMEAALAAHEAKAVSYGSTNVEEVLDTAAGHQANQNNPHGVTAAQAGAVALGDAVATVTANKVVRRDGNGRIAGDITGNSATATKLQTGKNINGVAFDGTSNITITAAANGGNANTVGGYTAAQLLAGVSGISLTNPGYVKFTTGLIIQWGRVSNIIRTPGSITFPIPFPTQVLSVVATYTEYSAASAHTFHPTTTTKTGFDFKWDYWDSLGVGNATLINYIAIGV